MKKGTQIVFTVVLLAAAFGAGWFTHVNTSAIPAKGTPAPAERKVLYYQSAMHPWIKSDKPGRCTICGMELTPVYEGTQGSAGSALDGRGDIVSLTQSQVHVMNVQTSEVKVQPLMKTLQVAGVVDDDERRHRIISAYVDGRVDKLFANHHGAEVTAGEPLAQIYSPALLQAEREYRQVTGDLKKNTALRLRQMGLTQGQIDALGTKPGDELESQILAPLSGTVVEHNVYEGQYVTAGEKMFEIADFSVMWFQFRAYEQDMPWIRIGQKVEVTTPSVPGKVFTGEITFIDPNFDEKTRSTQVRVELANPEVNGRRELLHKLYADGAVKVETPDLLTVPRSAVIQTGPDAVAYIDKGNGAYARALVTIGRHGDQLLEVRSGLKAGDKVVTNGNLLLDGQSEMNRTFAPHTDIVTTKPPETSEPAKHSSSQGLTDAQKDAISKFILVVDSMAEALSADDLATFNTASTMAMGVTANLVDALRPLERTPQAMDALEKARHFHGYTDIKSARIAFHAFTTAATTVLEPMRALDESPAFTIWECPMVDQAIPGAPKKGRWLQAVGRPGHNPFFGRDMLECADEMKPVDVDLKIK
jgi:Cu(I)/Ag(I) efflux system membrane fusion protein